MPYITRHANQLGISYNGQWYDSRALQRILQNVDNGELPVRVAAHDRNPDCIHVRDPKAQNWVRIPRLPAVSTPGTTSAHDHPDSNDPSEAGK